VTAASEVRPPFATKQRTWLVVFCAGLAVWLLAAFVTAITKDDILVPTLFLVGSFLVPMTVVVFALSRLREGHLTAEVVLLGFLAGGTVGVVVSAVTEVYLLPDMVGTFISVGVIEETSKGLVLLGVAMFVRERKPRDGMVLGATVGAGFAAFESSGYAFYALVQHQSDHPVLHILQTEISRAVLAPFGHITWTALLGGALFAASTPGGGYRVTSRLVGTILGIIALHAAWDASYGLAIVISEGLVGPGWDATWPNVTTWVGAPSQKEIWVFQVVYDGLLVINSVIGIGWVVLSWRQWGRGRSDAVTAPTQASG
jgi:RsiW-degrading membrane proteinase PrsW (M82 family)